MKCTNFASLDPSITSTGRTGLRGRSKLDGEIWGEFHADWERLAVECEQLRQHLLHEHGLSYPILQQVNDKVDIADFIGETRMVIAQQRIKQNFFRRTVLSSYRGRCCVSGVSEQRLLVASHIVPWSADVANRLNPSNGLCLSAIHDRAFDIGLFTLSKELRVVLSKPLRDTKDYFLKQVFLPIEGREIEVPERFSPDQKFLDHHRSVLFVDTKAA